MAFEDDGGDDDESVNDLRSRSLWGVWGPSAAAATQRSLHAFLRPTIILAYCTVLASHNARGFKRFQAQALTSTVPETTSPAHNYYSIDPNRDDNLPSGDPAGPDHRNS